MERATLARCFWPSEREKVRERERERERERASEREREREPNNGASDGNSLLLAARELRSPRAAMRGILVLERVDEVVGVGIACGSRYLIWRRREI